MVADSAKATSRVAGAAFRDHAANLQRFLISRVHHPQDADDLAQEVFTRLLRTRDIELVRSPIAYLLGIASHVVHEFRQRQQNERVVFNSALTDALCENPDDADNQQGFPEQLELQQRLDQALTELPPTHQLVVLLIKRDGLSYTEAAKTAGLSVHTIEKYLVEARARLRVSLAAL